MTHAEMTVHSQVELHQTEGLQAPQIVEMSDLLRAIDTRSPQEKAADAFARQDFQTEHGLVFPGAEKVDYLITFNPKKYAAASTSSERSVAREQARMIELERRVAKFENSTDPDTKRSLEYNRDEAARLHTQLVKQVWLGMDVVELKKIDPLPKAESDMSALDTPLGQRIAQGIGVSARGEPSKVSHGVNALAGGALLLNPAIIIHEGVSQATAQQAQYEATHILGSLAVADPADVQTDENGQMYQLVVHNGKELRVNLDESQLKYLEKMRASVLGGTQQDEIPERFTAFLPVAFQGESHPEPTPGDGTPTPPGGTDIPPITPTNEPPTVTVTATATEVGPLKEVALAHGVQVGILAGPSSSDALVFHNADHESGADVAGLVVDNLQNPVRDRDFIVGDAILPGDDPGTTQITELNHKQVVYVPKDQISQDQIDRIAPADPITDNRLGYELTMWNGKNGPLKLNANEAGADSIPNAVFNADFTKQSAVIELDGYASGSAKNADVYILSWNIDTREAALLVMQFDIGTRQWILRNKHMQYATTSSDDSDEQGKIIPPEINFNEIPEADWGTEIYRFPAGVSNISFTLSSNSVKIPGSEDPIPLPYGPSSGMLAHGIQVAREGSKQSSAQITLNKLRVAFSDIDGTPFREIPETIDPSISELATRAELIVLFPVREDALFRQPGIFEFFGQIGQLADGNDPDRATYISTENIYSDQSRDISFVLGGTDTEQVLLDKITSNPGATFQLSSIGSDFGLVGAWIDSDGTLARKQTVYKIVEAAKNNGSKIIIKTRIPLDFDPTSSEGGQISPMDQVLSEMRDVAAHVENPPIIITFDGDQNNYGSQPVTDEMTAVLRRVKDMGFETGLTEIVGNNAEWYETIVTALLNSESSVAGFGFVSVRRTTPNPIGIYKYQIAGMGTDPHDQLRYWRYTEGANVFRQTLIDYLAEK